MYEFEEVAQMLDEIADSMPYELYRDLNGGISLLPQVKIHPQALHNDLYILGEYIRNSLGNAIARSCTASSRGSCTTRCATTTSTSRARMTSGCGMMTGLWTICAKTAFSRNSVYREDSA